MTSNLTFCLLGESILPDEVNPKLNRQRKHIRPLTAQNDQSQSRILNSDVTKTNNTLDILKNGDNIYNTDHSSTACPRSNYLRNLQRWDLTKSAIAECGQHNNT